MVPYKIRTDKNYDCIGSVRIRCLIYMGSIRFRTYRTDCFLIIIFIRYPRMLIACIQVSGHVFKLEKIA